jgi:hypothetical protein
MAFRLQQPFSPKYLHLNVPYASEIGALANEKNQRQTMVDANNAACELRDRVFHVAGDP